MQIARAVDTCAVSNGFFFSSENRRRRVGTTVRLYIFVTKGRLSRTVLACFNFLLDASRMCRYVNRLESLLAATNI